MAESSTLLCYFATIPEAWPWMRQTEDGNGAMGRVQFVLASPASCSFPSLPTSAETSSAWLVVFDEAPTGFSTTVPRERRILFVTEPPEIKKYPRSYLGQFGTVVSPYDLRGVERRSMVISNPCLSWHYGVERSSGKNISKFSNLDELRTFPMPEKPGLVSVVCSSKTATSAQRTRLAAPNLGAVCPAPGFVSLPAGNLEACAQRILSAIKNRLGEARQAELAQCRNWMLKTINIFARAARMMETALEYCRRLPALCKSEPKLGVSRDNVAVMYRQVRGEGK
ncbi:MAG TPA: hypothetical protein VEZ52_08905 [Desulfovibrio sp.]|uniref:hypothetical protein n=1 Tax=Desulfovibrio sp. TaxID=885 RepID=UPI002D378B66|nr:hypothetical protein [Desulfovibrio sp.]HZF61724.1 hypothetical protein [Desulfovibrio sp.]